mgnify:CR=1 FL=1
MLDFLKLGIFNKSSVRNEAVSELNASIEPAVINHAGNTVAQTERLTENLANRILPENNVINASKLQEYSKMYSELSEFVEKGGKEGGKEYLKTLHVNKKLFSTSSNDGSSTIENLYKIMKQPRAGGFDPKIILHETAFYNFIIIY